MGTTRPIHIMIVAGEASGDMHAAHLIEEIKKINPAVTFSGLGGPAMKDQGVEIYEDLTRLAVVGFVEVFKHYGEIRRMFYLFLNKVRAVKPAAVILVDYPGFNLRLAKKLKKLNVKVIYYISPQVWAWKENRVETIRRYTDQMLVLFKFEEEFYAKHNLKVAFVGHPLIDLVEAQTGPVPPEPISNQVTIGLLPGSRHKEIKSLLPVMLDAAAILQERVSGLRFLLFKAPTISEHRLEEYVHNVSLPITLVRENIYQGIAQCNFCLVASGTATLEVAILNKPMVIIYKTSLLTWLIAKALIKIPYIGLVNIVAGKKIVPECIQHDANGRSIAAQILRMVNDPQKQDRMKEELEKVRLSLGSGGAGRRAAEEVLKTIERIV